MKRLSNTAAVVKLRLSFVRYTVLVRKLGPLLNLTDDEADSVGAMVFHCLMDDVSSICLVRECQELEEHFGTSVTYSILHRSETSIRAVKISLRRLTRRSCFGEILRTHPLLRKLREMFAGLNRGKQHSTWERNTQED